jgi:hypothetical protein
LCTLLFIKLWRQSKQLPQIFAKRLWQQTKQLPLDFCQNFGYQPNGVFLPQNMACHKCGYYQILAWQTMARNQSGPWCVANIQSSTRSLFFLLNFRTRECGHVGTENALQFANYSMQA